MILLYILYYDLIVVVYCSMLNENHNKQEKHHLLAMNNQRTIWGPNPEKVGCGVSKSPKKASPQKNPRADLPAGDDAGRRSESY